MRHQSYFLAPLPLIIIHTTCISLCLRRTSAPIHLTSVLGVLGTQETSYILIAGLLERDTFDHFFPEFNKPWVIHLRENLLLFYKPLHLEAQQLSTRIEVHRHQAIFWRCCRGGKVKGIHIGGLKKKNLPRQTPIFWRRCRGGKVKGTHILRCECSKLFPLDSIILSFCFLFSLVRLNGKQQKN